MQFNMPTEISDVTIPEDKILVSILDTEEKTHGGLILDPRHSDKFKSGIVVLTGPGKLLEDSENRLPLLLKTGDIVLFDTAEGKFITINNKKFKIFDETTGLVAKIGELNNAGELEFYADTKF